MNSFLGGNHNKMRYQEKDRTLLKKNNSSEDKR